MTGAGISHLSTEVMVNLSLQAFNDLQGLPQVIESTEKHRTLLADKLGDEFGKQFIIKGAGDEYQRINEIKATNAKLIIPVTFPDAYDVDDPYDALNVSLADLKHWELAAKNAAVLASNSVAFAFTSSGLKDPSQFLTNIRKTVQYGLGETEALKALTYNPASFLGVADKVGSLKNGALANFTITDGNIFSSATKVYESWVKGNGKTIIDMEATDRSGTYELSLDGKTFDVEISGTAGAHKAKVMMGDSTIASTAEIDDVSISLTFDPSGNGDFRLSGVFSDGKITGEGQNLMVHGSNGLPIGQVMLTLLIARTKMSRCRKPGTLFFHSLLSALSLYRRQSHFLSEMPPSGPMKLMAYSKELMY